MSSCLCMHQSCSGGPWPLQSLLNLKQAKQKVSLIIFRGALRSADSRSDLVHTAKLLGYSRAAGQKMEFGACSRSEYLSDLP